MILNLFWIELKSFEWKNNVKAQACKSHLMHICVSLFVQPDDDFGGVLGSESEDDSDDDDQEDGEDGEDDELPIEKASKKLQKKREKEKWVFYILSERVDFTKSRLF